jgi:hypothetical protein
MIELNNDRDFRFYFPCIFERFTLNIENFVNCSSQHVARLNGSDFTYNFVVQYEREILLKKREM